MHPRYLGDPYGGHPRCLEDPGHGHSACHHLACLHPASSALRGRRVGGKAGPSPFVPTGGRCCPAHALTFAQFRFMECFPCLSIAFGTHHSPLRRRGGPTLLTGLVQGHRPGEEGTRAQDSCLQVGAQGQHPCCGSSRGTGSTWAVLGRAEGGVLGSPQRDIISLTMFFPTLLSILLSPRTLQSWARTLGWPFSPSHGRPLCWMSAILTPNCHPLRGHCRLAPRLGPSPLRWPLPGCGWAVSILPRAAGHLLSAFVKSCASGQVRGRSPLLSLGVPALGPPGTVPGFSRGPPPNSGETSFTCSPGRGG